MRRISITALPGIGAIGPNADLPSIVALALRAADLSPTSADVLVVAQKIVSKAEGREVDLRQVRVSERARELARVTGKDPRIIEVVLAESAEVMRAVPGVLIVRHRLGYVVANAGVDRSNVQAGPGEERALLLPVDPDASAERLRAELHRRYHLDVGIIISDSFGRAWRTGVTNVALGAAGVPAVIDLRGQPDLFGRKLETTDVAFADAVAAAAALVQGEADEGTPIALVQGLDPQAPARPARDLVRPLEIDLF